MGKSKTQTTTKSLIAYTYSHFCVDFVCFYILYYGLQGMVDNAYSVMLGFLIYNIIAFGLQSLIGYYCDEHPRFPTAIVGVTLVLFGTVIVMIRGEMFQWSFLPWFAMLVAALGNAFFHVGGGIDSLIYANGKISRSGVFVSSGAVGVVLGTLYGKNQGGDDILPMALLVLAILAIHKWSIKQYVSGEASQIFELSEDSSQKSSKKVIDIAAGINVTAAITMILAAVMIRSYAGGLIPQEWKIDYIAIIVAGIAACLGKAVGGFWADRFGANNVGVNALILSIPFVLLGRNRMIISVIGIMLFNMPMPITLCALASIFPKNPGLAFGLTTLALLLGTLPVLVYQATGTTAMTILVVLTIIAALFIGVTTKNGEKA